ncbi:MAG: IS3 family transposase [Proteobacteria bacterium]|nr:IS3 family transposase [Pseudomonadota bacterium]
MQRMCTLAALSRAGYYRHWRVREPRREETELRDAIQRRCLSHRHYGYRRITVLLSREGWWVNHKRVNRLMREDNLLCLRRKADLPATTDSKHRLRVYPNLARRLIPMAVNQLWVADITYVRLSESFAYLAVVLDAYSRRVVGWALAAHLQAILALEALEMALSQREFTSGGLVHHSDRGVQYASGDYIARLDGSGIVASMSRVACPYDNAMAESFMKTLKTEEVEGQAYRDISHAREDIGAFIEEVYNRHRLHSALDYLSPEEFENNQPEAWLALKPAKLPIAATCP